MDIDEVNTDFFRIMDELVEIFEQPKVVSCFTLHPNMDDPKLVCAFCHNKNFHPLKHLVDKLSQRWEFEALCTAVYTCDMYFFRNMAIEYAGFIENLYVQMNFCKQDEYHGGIKGLCSAARGYGLQQRFKISSCKKYEKLIKYIDCPCMSMNNK